jgi:peptide/nickel transport system permease protein
MNTQPADSPTLLAQAMRGSKALATEESPRKGFYYYYQRIFMGDPLAMLGVVLLLGLVLIALLGPFFVRYDPFLTTSDTLKPPSSTYWFGTDQFGRDIYSRSITSLRIDFMVSIVGVSGAILIGVIIGALCGYLGGTFDDAVMRLVDIIQSFPPGIH